MPWESLFCLMTEWKSLIGEGLSVSSIWVSPKGLYSKILYFSWLLFNKVNVISLYNMYLLKQDVCFEVHHIMQYHGTNT